LRLFIPVVRTGNAASASDFKVGAIHHRNAVVAANTGGGKVAAGYLTIKNGAAASGRLVSVTADFGPCQSPCVSHADKGVKESEHGGKNGKQ
jgi:copper(I)-binding protein